MKENKILIFNFLLIFTSALLLQKFNSIFATLIILIILNIILQKINLLNCKKMIQQQKNEIENLNYICDSTRTFRHDFNNIMQAIGGYIQTNNIYDLKQYYNHLIPECFKINNLYRFHSKLIANSAIYSIISDKYNLAENNNIKMSLNILLDLNCLRIDTYTLTRILGILLDNAIEASKECNQKIINLSFQTSNNKQLIIIENTYLNKGISIKKIFDKNYTTKEKNSGLGLWQVSKIIQKNKNLHLSTKAGDEFFSQCLEIS